MGSEHALLDAHQARSWLEQEVRTLGVGPLEPVVDPISVDGRIVRVNLRPYVAARGDLERLLQAFLRTANEYRVNEAQLERYWAVAERMAGERELAFPENELQSFIAEMKLQGYPAVHHSERYARAYRPAYRVIAHEFLAHG